MNWFQRLTRKSEMERRLDAELRHHFDSLVASAIRAGLSEPEARRKARLEFGAMEAVKDDCRDARGTVLFESCVKDLQLALRTLGKSPIFSLAAIATLALGIGANTAIFQLLDAVLFRSLPVPDARHLAIIQIRSGNGGFGISRGGQNLTWPIFQGIRTHQEGFTGVAAWGDDMVPTGVAPDRHARTVIFVSGEFFPMLKLTPSAGHLLSALDDQPSCASPGIVLSHAFWQNELGGQASAVGRRFVVDDHPFEIVGVAPPAFTGLEVGKKFDLALPICSQAVLHNGEQGFARADFFWLNVIGRLKPGWTREQASTQLLSISPGLFAATAPVGYTPESIARYKRRTLEAIPGANGVSWLRAQYRTSLYLLLSIAGLVMLIACANLANLMLARASSRRREFSVRIALGASRSRLLRQAMAEGLLLAAIGGGTGFLLAGVLSRAVLAALATGPDSLHLNLTPDWRMLAFTGLTALTACFLFGLVPALRVLRSDPGEMMKAGGRGLTVDRKRFSFQRALIVVQVSISLVLVAGALLLVRSFRNLTTLDPGFRTKGIVIAAFDMSRTHMPVEQIKPAVQSLVDEVRSIPLVEAAAATTNIAINGGSWTLGLTGDLQGSSKFTWVSPGYFDTVQTPITAGRDFTSGDTATGPKVVVVNETFSRRHFPGVNPIGKTFRSASEPGYPEAEYQVVAVCKDTRYFDLRDVPPPQSYAPIAQHPSYGPWAALYVRSSAPLNEVIQEIKRRIARSRPGVGMEFRIFETEVMNTLLRERLLASLSGFFGALAALLASIGLYGVINYFVAWRRNEIGIRMALGATQGGIVGLFMKEAILLAALGIAIGLVGSVIFARAAKSLLFGFAAYDPLTYCAAAAVLAGIAILGSYVPARRAARLDPVSALHYE